MYTIPKTLEGLFNLHLPLHRRDHLLRQLLLLLRHDGLALGLQDELALLLVRGRELKGGGFKITSNLLSNLLSFRTNSNNFDAL